MKYEFYVGDSEQSKEIERLPDDIRATFVINDKHVHIKQYNGDNNKWSCMCYPKEFIDKINELVDAVNELREAKNDKSIS